MNDDDFGDFLEYNRDKIVKDVKIIINKEFIIESSRVRLSIASIFFRNLLSSKFKETKEVEIYLPCGNIVLFEILLNYLLLGHLIVPYGMSHQSWIELYRLANYFSLKILEQVCLGQIHGKLTLTNVDEIMKFCF